VSTHATPSTPARLTETATTKLPRLFLVLVGALYILSGLFFRDPWKTDDVVGLATMVTALEDGGIAMLVPQIGALAHAQDGPLITWVGAFSIWLFAPLLQWFLSPLEATLVAARLPNLLWFGILTSSIWYGTYLLGRRSEAQPLALPFGGEPTTRDYGRMIADAALLLIIATVGIIWRMHETSEVPAIIAFQALAFYAVARMLDRPLSGAITLGLAIAAAFLTRGGLGGFPVMAAALLAFAPRGPLWQQKKWLFISILLASSLVALWLVPAYQASAYWVNNWVLWHTQSITGPHIPALFRALRDLPWFLWPTWPFALLALWRWREWIYAPHIWTPLSFAIGALGLMLFLADIFEPEYSLVAVPAAILAAFSLPTLRRSIVNSLDWFAIMCFTLTAATAWLGWIALQTGWPGQISNNIARQTQGFDIVLSWPAVAMAMVGTLIWLGLVYWRLHGRPLALWRGTVLSAGGLVTTWLLLVVLWMPALDYARTYRDVSGELAKVIQAHLRPGECIRSIGLGTGQRASFLVFDKLEFNFSSRCPLILQQTSPHQVRDGSAAFPATDAQVLWEGKRIPDRHELFRLLRVNHP
jgi:4-amino-4-deoxy-L-arabinose transferase-like glycosyltransferase